jgi:hypothetical protein
MSHRRESFYFILSVPLLLSKAPCHAHESAGRRRSSPSIIGGVDDPAPANPSGGSSCVLDRLSAFLSEDIGSVLKGGGVKRSAQGSADGGERRLYDSGRRTRLR